MESILVYWIFLKLFEPSFKGVQNPKGALIFSTYTVECLSADSYARWMNYF